MPSWNLARRQLQPPTYEWLSSRRQTAASCCRWSVTFVTRQFGNSFIAIQHRSVTDVIRVHRRSSCPGLIRRRNRRHLPTWVACCSSVIPRRVRGHHGVRCNTPRTRLRGRRCQHTVWSTWWASIKAVLRSPVMVLVFSHQARHTSQGERLTLL